MYRIVNLGQTGIFVVIRKGAVATLGGRCHWDTADQVRQAVVAAHVLAPDHVMSTRR